MKKTNPVNDREYSKIKIFLSLLLFALLDFAFISCNQEKNDTGNMQAASKDTINVLIDEAIAPMLEEPFKMYRESKPEIVLLTKVVKSREAMALLLSGKTKVAILARDYMKDEDSIMNAYGISPYPRKLFAQDALVFFAQKYFPIDTLNTILAKKLLTEKDISLVSYFPQLKTEPEIVINNNLSSEFANMFMLAAENKPIQKRLKTFSSSDSVVSYVCDNFNAIGIGLLSQVVIDGRLKCLRMGYVDSTGTYVPATKPVHQAYIVMGQYPYIVDEYVYLFDDLRNTAYWFAEFIAKERVVVEYFKNYGIAPVFMKYSLIKTD